MTEAAINIQNLSKRYTSRSDYALKDLTLKVSRGEVYGFLGPNGAGKSTTIRLLLNFIRPSSGSASILDQDIVRDSVKLKRSVGYLSGDVALYGKMTGRQLIEYMKELSPLKHESYLKQLIDTYQVQLDQPIDELSKGNRQKIGLVQAFMHEPEVLILDEPTSGLDPLMQATFFDYVKSAKAAGASVFLSSHDLAEVQKMCDRIGFIRDGKLIVEQTIADLSESASHQYEVTFAGPAPFDSLRDHYALKIDAAGANSVIIHVQGDLAPMFKLLAKHKVVSIDKKETSLEEEFLRFYGKGGA